MDFKIILSIAVSNKLGTEFKSSFFMHISSLF